MQIMDFPDPRRPIDKLRRVTLRTICQRKGIRLSEPLPPASVMKALIEAEGGLEAVLQRPDRPTPSPEQLAASEPASQEAVRHQLEAMKMPDIRILCSKQGVVWGPKDKKDVLIERLLEPAR